MTIQVIVGGILFQSGSILLGRRAPHKRAYANCWDILGGHIEVGESAAAALIREVEEEAGVTPTGFEAIRFFPIRDPNGEGSLDYHIFLVTDWTGGEPRMLGDEHTELRWFTLAEADHLGDLAVPQYYKPLFQSIARGGQ